MSASFTLAYGRTRLDVRPASGRFDVLAGQPPAPLADAAAALRDALEVPTAGAPLAARLRPGDRVTIVVSDGSRVTGVREVLPALLDVLDALGVTVDRVRVLFALGMHRPQTASERVAILGPEVGGRVAHADHLCDEERQLDLLTADGPLAGIRLNRQVLDDGLVILTGAIGFHYLAGFGGGRKAVLPGVAARASVRAFHSRSLAPEAGAGRHPNVAPGVRDGNPLDDLACAVAAQLPRTFLLNTIMRPGGGIAAVVTGDVGRAFDLGCERYREWFTVRSPARRPVVIVSAGGAPRDRDLVQSQKAMAAAAAALAPDGMMLVLAACPEGAGHPELAEWFQYRDRAAHVEALRRDFSVPGQTALALREHAERHRVFVRSELPRDLVLRMGMTPVEHPDEFLGAVAERHGGDVEGYVMPEGGRYLPVIAA